MRKLNKILVDKVYNYVYEIGSSRKVIYLTDKYIMEDHNTKLINAKFNDSNQPTLCIDTFWGEITSDNTYTTMKNDNGMYLFYKNKFLDYEYKAKNYVVYFEIESRSITIVFKNNRLYFNKKGEEGIIFNIVKNGNQLPMLSIGDDTFKINKMLNKYKKIGLRVYKNHQEFINML
jgi:hypothetical protein